MANNSGNNTVPNAPPLLNQEVETIEVNNVDEKYENLVKSSAEKIKQLEDCLKKKDEELLGANKRVTQLEEELGEAQKFKAQHAKDAEEVATLKIKSEDTLTRAKAIIFDKTKVIKNQELQIDAYNQQITSLKDVVSITKDLLEIRNLEIKQLEGKINCMEEKINAERERHNLMHKKLEHMIRHNGDLKREYETQLCLFQALRERYSERELAKGVVADSRAETNRSVSENGVNGASSSIDTAEPEAAAVVVTGSDEAIENQTTKTDEEPTKPENV